MPIKKGRWWQSEGDSKGNARKGSGRKKDTVNHVEESPLEKQVRELTGAMAQLAAGQQKMQQQQQEVFALAEAKTAEEEAGKISKTGSRSSPEGQATSTEGGPTDT